MTPVDTSITERLRLSSDADLRRRFMVTDEHVRANVRVGMVLEVLDKLAEETALRYVRQFELDARVVTAAMDDLDVRNAPDIEQDMLLHARINFVGRTSMEVGVRIEQGGAEKVHIASCYFTMVARKDGQSLLVQPLEYRTEDELLRSRRAAERRSERLRNSAIQFPKLEEYALLHELHRHLNAPSEVRLLARNLVTSGWSGPIPNTRTCRKPYLADMSSTMPTCTPTFAQR